MIQQEAKSRFAKSSHLGPPLCSFSGRRKQILLAVLCRNDGSSQKVSLVATGALTNVALLLSVYPEIKDMIEVGFGITGCLTFEGLRQRQ